MDGAAKAIKNEDKSIWIMPEGTRSKGRGLMPFKKGAFVTAIKAQVPIVTVAWSNYINDLNINHVKAGTILVEILPPIQTKGLTMDDVDALKEKAYNQLKEALARLDQEVALMDKKRRE